MSFPTEANVIARIPATLGENETAGFSWRDSIGLNAEGFVFRKNGSLYAYKNVCRHQPLTLDYGDGELFTEDAAWLLCRNHGALFDPQTGVCVEGPCLGAALFPLEVRQENGEILVFESPENEPELE